MKIPTKADISAAIVCLKGESQLKGSLFSFNHFLHKHNLDNSFRDAMYELKIYRSKKFILNGLITPELIDKVYDFIKNYEQHFKEVQENKKRRIARRRVIQILDQWNIKNEDIYISVQSAITLSIPEELLQKGIGMGNGIFLINIKHYEKYVRENAGS